MDNGRGEVSSSFYRYLEATAGCYLRTVVRYERRSWAEVYRREDLANEETVADRAVTRKCRAAGESATDGHRCTVQVYDEAVLLDFPISGSRGVLVSLDPGAARDLGSFVDRCESRLAPTRTT